MRAMRELDSCRGCHKAPLPHPASVGAFMCANLDIGILAAGAGVIADKREKQRCSKRSERSDTHLFAQFLNLILAQRLALHELCDPAVHIVVQRHGR